MIFELHKRPDIGRGSDVINTVANIQCHHLSVNIRQHRMCQPRKIKSWLKMFAMVNLSGLNDMISPAWPTLNLILNQP